MAAAPRPSLDDLLGLAQQINLDQSQSEAELRQRDQSIGASLRESLSSEDWQNETARILGWLNHTQSQNPSPDTPPTQLQNVIQWLWTLLTLIGLGLGLAAAMAVLHYDGKVPVNVVKVVAVFALLPLLMLGLTVLATVTDTGPLGKAIRSLSPGRLSGLLLGLLPEKYRKNASILVGDPDNQVSLPLAGVQKWLVLVGAQWLGVGFFAGACVMTGSLIVLSDISFGWGTTLDAAASEWHAVTSTLALPWGWAWPDASPSLQIIEATRFHRLPNVMQSLDAEVMTDASAWRAWWPFVMMLVIMYGLVPRIAALIWTKHRLQSRITHAFTRMPGTAMLIDRLESSVHAHALHDQAPSKKPALAVAQELPGMDSGQQSGRAILALLNWGESPKPEEFAELDDWAIGGRQSLAEDKQTLDNLGQKLNQFNRSRDSGRVIVLCRGWEPPTLELLDFLELLRQVTGSDILIELRVMQADDEAMAVYQTSIKPLSDARLIVRQEGAS